MRRRQVLGCFGACAVAGSAPAVRAQGHPGRLVKISVPYAPGGSPDTVARILSQYLPMFLGQAVAVENVPGSSGISAIGFFSYGSSRGTGQSGPALVAGQVSMAIASHNVLAPFARAGKVRVIAATTREPSALLPQFPPMGDARLRDFDFPGENALFAPRGTPRSVVDTLVAAVTRVLALPEAGQKYHAAGLGAPRVPGPAALVETMQRDIQRYAQAVKVAGIQPE